jgi:hypothetical protein
MIETLSEVDCMKFAPAFLERKKKGFGRKLSTRYWRKKVKDDLTAFVLGQKVPSRDEANRLRKLCPTALLRRVGILDIVEGKYTAGPLKGCELYPLLLNQTSADCNSNASSSSASIIASSNADGVSNVAIAAGQCLPSSALLGLLPAAASTTSSLPSSGTSTSLARNTCNVLSLTGDGPCAPKCEYSDKELFADWICQHGVTNAAVNDLLSRFSTFRPSALQLPKRRETLMKVMYNYHKYVNEVNFE